MLQKIISKPSEKTCGFRNSKNDVPFSLLKDVKHTTTNPGLLSSAAFVPACHASFLFSTISCLVGVIQKRKKEIKKSTFQGRGEATSEGTEQSNYTDLNHTPLVPPFCNFFDFVDSQLALFLDVCVIDVLSAVVCGCFRCSGSISM